MICKHLCDKYHKGESVSVLLSQMGNLIDATTVFLESPSIHGYDSERASWFAENFDCIFQPVDRRESNPHMWFTLAQVGGVPYRLEFDGEHVILPENALVQIRGFHKLAREVAVVVSAIENDFIGKVILPDNYIMYFAIPVHQIAYVRTLVRSFVDGKR